jgi:hypothetical protein
MNLSSKASPQQDPQVVYRIHRIFWAVCMLLAPLALSLWFGSCPQYGDPACPNNESPFSILAAYRAANPLLMEVFFFVSMVSLYVYPLSYIGLGLVAMKRSPWLATLGIACGFIGSMVWGLVTDQSFWLNGIASLKLDGLYPTMGKAYSAHWEFWAIAGGWVIGHLLGYLLLGIALLRARVIPMWAAWLIIVSAPVMGPIAYGTRIGVIQIIGYLMVFIGSVPAALAMLKGREWKSAQSG